MPGRSEIKAGGAYVELTLRTPLFLLGLKGAMRHLGGFARRLFGLKGLLAAVGANICPGLTLRALVGPTSTASRSPARFFAALGFAEDDFAQTDILGRDFDQLVVVDVFQGHFQGEGAGRFQQDVAVAAGGADVG